MELTSRQRRMLDEADMSRRDFLKTTGKLAAGAASPKSMLKGLMGSAGTPVSSIPKTPNEAAVALIAWAKSTGKYQDWYNKCIKFFQEHPGYWGPPNPTRDQIEKEAVGRINDWAVWNAMDVDPDITNVWGATSWIVWDGTHRGAEDRLPPWISRYRLARWAGRDIPDHPFIKDREKWDKLLGPINTGKASPEVKAEFLDIIKNTLPPKHLDKAIEQVNKTWNQTHQTIHKEFDPVEQEPYDTTGDEGDPDKQEEEPQDQFSDETDQWRTQSVEFESRLRRLVR
jgi:hypothetical protein